MSYRIEFLAECNESGVLACKLGDVRFSIFQHAIAAARAEASQRAKEGPVEIIVNIFDRRDRLASRLQLAVSETTTANDEPEG